MPAKDLVRKDVDVKVLGLPREEQLDLLRISWVDDLTGKERPLNESLPSDKPQPTRYFWD